MTAPTLTITDADLSQLHEALVRRQAQRDDHVVGATRLHASDGLIVVEGAGGTVLDDTGVGTIDRAYAPTRTAVSQIAAKLDIPGGYLHTCQQHNVELFDSNINGWLAHQTQRSKKFLVRGLVTPDATDGVMRALLSGSYQFIEDLDVLLSTLEGIKAAGVNVDIGRCNLTEGTMYVEVNAPEVYAKAPELLQGYRSPFTGESGTECPLIFAGFVIQNSEVGQGAAKITPRITVQVCRNGMTMTTDAFAERHVGAQLAEGTVEWSAETQAKILDLIRSQATDAVRHFLSRDYVTAKVGEMAAKAGVEIPDGRADATIKRVTAALKYTEAQGELILSHFVKAGQHTAGGVMQAVTSAAQLQSCETRYQMEGHAMRVLELAAA
jgi:hypothetical protein